MREAEITWSRYTVLIFRSGLAQGEIVQRVFGRLPGSSVRQNSRTIISLKERREDMEGGSQPENILLGVFPGSTSECTLRGEPMPSVKAQSLLRAWSKHMIILSIHMDTSLSWG